MKETSETTISSKPESNEAMVVFMRPSTFKNDFGSSVFDITENREDLVGIVPAKKKVVYKTNPGEHMFMVIGETADFMRANLQAGKTYYALVTPHMGGWKARFALRPVSKKELNSKRLNSWLSSCKIVENTKDSFEWVKQNAPSIQSKKQEFLTEWNARPEKAKPMLNPDDGL